VCCCLSTWSLPLVLRIRWLRLHAWPRPRGTPQAAPKLALRDDSHEQGGEADGGGAAAGACQVPDEAPGMVRSGVVARLARRAAHAVVQCQQMCCYCPPCPLTPRHDCRARSVP